MEMRLRGFSQIDSVKKPQLSGLSGIAISLEKATPIMAFFSPVLCFM
jgi:hypothetical protein